MKPVVASSTVFDARLVTHDESKSSRMDDDGLVARLKMRDKTGLSDLVEQHGSMMYGVAFHLMRNEDGAREVVQDALIAVWNKAHSYRGQSKLGTWLYRVTANAALMQLRKQQRSRQLISFDGLLHADRLAQPRDDNRPDTALLRSELGEHVHRAIDALPEPHRTTVIMADAEGLSLAEIAELTQVSVPAVKSRLHRARLILRKKLSAYVEARPRSAEAAVAFAGFCGA